MSELLPDREMAERLSLLWADTLERAALTVVAAGHEPERCKLVYLAGTSKVTIHVNLVGDLGTPVWEQWMEMTPGTSDRGQRTVEKVAIEVVGRWLVEMDDQAQPVIPGPQ